LRLWLDSLADLRPDLLQILRRDTRHRRHAAALTISEKTVAAHLTSVFTKLQTKDRFEAMIWGIDNLSDILELYLGFNLDKPLG
jgi:FixJ family two-component response regulator